ncbi:MAG TPA: hypothetical protein VFW23_13970 [Tepidisphaeraceae bacterium]|nr:hypothetical protein [Tepidisphaeraceae bacterium]
MTIALFPGRLASGSNFWCEAKDGDLECFAIARRHYSAAKNLNPKIKQFVGPGEPLVLITPEIFGDGRDYQRHYSTEAEALEGHRKIVDGLKAKVTAEYFAALDKLKELEGK